MGIAVTTESIDAALRRYATRVAESLGVGTESLWCEVADHPTIYIVWRDRARDLAVTWTLPDGWSVAEERGTTLEPLAHLGDPLVPPPACVVDFVHAAARGRVGTWSTPTTAPDDLADLLSDY